jgi:hypothetical protein
MTIGLSTTAELLSQKSTIEPNLILEIDGIDTIFGAITTTELIRIGAEGLVIGDDWVIGGVIPIEDQKPYIGLSKGTTTRITQQLLQDKGGTGSIGKMNIRLVDKNGEVLPIFSRGQVVTDPLGNRCRVYLNFKGGAHPEDSVNILNGYLSDIDPGAGYLDIKISHSEGYKSAEIFEKVETELDGSITDSQTTIDLDDTTDLLLQQDVLTTYVRIGDEIIKYTGISGNQLTGCVRGQFGTTPSAASDEDDVSSFYVLQVGAGETIDLALKVMLSNGGSNFQENVAVKHFEYIDPSLSVENAVFFYNVNIESRYGLVSGDLMSISGASQGANNFTDRTIQSIEVTNLGSYAIVDGADLVQEIDSSAVASFKSKYNTLPEGAGLAMTPIDVDVPEHERLRDLLSTSLPGYTFYLTETKKGQDFVNEQIYFPAALYQVPRKGKSSLNIALPPLAVDDVKTLDENVIKNPSKLKVNRSSQKYFYNKIVYNYERDVLDDRKFRKKKGFKSDRSFSDIDVGSRPMTINAEGFRKGQEGVIEVNGTRLLNRYQFGAEWIPNVQVLYSVGFNIEVGDSVILDTNNLHIANTGDGDRSRVLRLMEVINKDLNYENGQVSLTILDTAFGLDVRYGVIGPSSKVAATGSTVGKLVLQRSYGTRSTELERDKWDRYIGEKVLVHNTDWSFQEEVTLDGFDESQDGVAFISPDLSLVPDDDYTMDMPLYSGTLDEKITWKNLNVYLCPEVGVASGISSTKFTVAVGDEVQFFVNSIVRVHTLDFSTDSGVDTVIRVTDVTGQTITVDKTLGFTPTASMVVTLIGFSDDEGKPYSYF